MHVKLWCKQHTSGEFWLAFSVRRQEKWPDQSFQSVKGLCVGTKDYSKLEETIYIWYFIVTKSIK